MEYKAISLLIIIQLLVHLIILEELWKLMEMIADNKLTKLLTWAVKLILILELIHLFILNMLRHKRLQTLNLLIHMFLDFILFISLLHLLMLLTLLFYKIRMRIIQFILKDCTVQHHLQHLKTVNSYLLSLFQIQ